MRPNKFTEQGSISIQCKFHDPFLCVEVTDTGIGIPSDGMEKLFKPFSQVDCSISRKFGGTGLGLAICKRIVELMNGNISAQSQMGKGSSFTFNVVVQKSESCHHSPGSSRVNSANANMTEEWKRLLVLLVEDNKVNQMLAKRILSKVHVSIDVANDGFEGIEMASEVVYDLILMDLSMPGLFQTIVSIFKFCLGMSGDEAARRILNQCNMTMKRPPFIAALTANALSSDRQLCYAAGMQAFITKPFTIKDLKVVLDDAVAYKFDVNS